MKRWVPVLIVGSVFTEPHPQWGKPRASFNAAYRAARVRAWFADHLDPRYASEEISLQWAVADRLALPQDTRDLLDRMYGSMGGELSLPGPVRGELSTADTPGRPAIPETLSRTSSRSVT